MLEIIAETVADASAAEAGGATQLDLKSDFVENGLTPTAGMVERICSRVDIDVIVMVRTRANGMVLTPDDIAIMCSDIRLSRERGAVGFLLGAITEDRRIDVEAIKAFQEAAGDLPLHFHLAWELTENLEETLERLIDLGIKSVRTTGGLGVGGKAEQGVDQIKAFREQAAGRLDLLLAGGVSAENVGRLVTETGVIHAHAGSSVRIPPNPRGIVDEDKVRALREALDRALGVL
jgi:copper homeostasis protein